MYGIILLSFMAYAGPAKEIDAQAGSHLQRPKFSPDGMRLAYEANAPDRQTTELYVGDPIKLNFSKIILGGRGSTITAGFSSNQGGVAHDLSWSPASLGKYLYSSANTNQDFDLYLSGGTPIAVAPGHDGGPAWSPNGSSIVFTSARSGQGDLYLLDATHLDAPPRRLTWASDSSELFPAWSPDSQKLVYVAHGKTGDNLWLMPSLDSSPVQLTIATGSQLRPAFSPDGSKIAYYANVEDKTRWDLYLIDAVVGATPIRLLRDVLPNSNGPTFTPDGRHILVVLDDDARFDPMSVVAIAEPGKSWTVDFGTVGHRDIDVVVKPDSKVWIVFTAQGKKSDTKRTFDRLYLAELPKW